MKPFMRTLTIAATVAAPLAVAPAFAGTVHAAPNGSYARQTQGAQHLSPHWYGYHNWRSRNAFQTRAALHKEAAHSGNGKMAAGSTSTMSQPSGSASEGAHSVRVSSNGDYALSTQGSRELAPHWYGYHNWRTANAFHNRLALHRETQSAQMASRGGDSQG